jgi:chromosome partitioning protein
MFAVQSHEPASPRLIVAVANQKGGVGKTTTVLNLATALATAGRQTLIIDLDPQGNASTGIDIPRSARSPGTYALLLGDGDPRRLVQETQVPNLAIIPSDPDLAGAEIELVTEPRREFRLRDAVRALDTFQIIIIDCPPSLSLLTLNGLVASTSILVPLQCEFFALEGLSQLVQTIERVHSAFNESASLDGIVLTMFDRRNNLSELVAADARSFFGDLVYETVIPRNVRVSEAPSHGKPVMLYDFRSPGAQAYARLAAEFLRRTQHFDGAATAA